MVEERKQQEADRAQQCDVISSQLQRKNEQAKAARARLLAARKTAMLGRTGIPALAEQRKKVSQCTTATR